jgi:hypothetical protein
MTGEELDYPTMTAPIPSPRSGADGHDTTDTTSACPGLKAGVRDSTSATVRVRTIEVTPGKASSRL